MISSNVSFLTYTAKLEKILLAGMGTEENPIPLTVLNPADLLNRQNYQTPNTSSSVSASNRNSRLESTFHDLPIMAPSSK